MISAELVAMFELVAIISTELVAIFSAELVAIISAELVAIFPAELVVWLVAMTAAEERLGDGSGVLAKYEEVVCSARMLLVEDTAFTTEEC